MKKKIEKNENNDSFISPKRKKTNLEMALKSFNISILDHQMSKSWKQLKREKTNLEMALKSFDISILEHQMSKSWKQSVAHAFETATKFARLKNWVPDCLAQDRISAKVFYTQNISSSCTSSPVGNIQILYFYHFSLSFSGWKFALTK